MNENQNLESGLKPAAGAPPIGAAAASAPDDAGPLFFNVMPQNKNQGGLVAPELMPQQISGGGGISGLKNFTAKNKWLLIIAAAVLIGGPAVYLLVSKIGGNSYKTENIIVKQPPPAGQKPAAGAATSTPNQTAGFTTSQAWRDKYFPGCADSSLCGDNADPDHDGLTNVEEYKLGADPNNSDSDQDGLADGDEAHVFGTNPLNAHTASDSRYSDADYFKGGYDIGTGKKMTPAQVAAVSEKMRQFGLHEPTVKTLGNILNALYNFSASNSNGSASSTADSFGLASSTPVGSASSTVGLDQSLAAKQDRDAQRSATIKNVEVALVKYQSDNKAYPQTNDFATMFANIKLYLKVATNPVDPVNKDPYIYAYSSNQQATDFTLSFFSEVAGQIIKKTAADAVKDAGLEQASVYDNQRQSDLENLRSALLLYSQQNAAGTQTYVFPGADKYKTAIVPAYISQIPKDPKTGADYDYQVSATFDTFTLKAMLDNPPTGASGYLCNQEECRNY